MTSTSTVDTLGSILPESGLKTVGPISDVEGHPEFADVLKKTTQGDDCVKCGTTGDIKPATITTEGEAVPTIKATAVMTEMTAVVATPDAVKDPQAITMNLLAAGEVSPTALALAAGALAEAGKSGGEPATPLATVPVAEIAMPTSDVQTETTELPLGLSMEAIKGLAIKANTTETAAPVAAEAVEAEAVTTITPDGLEVPTLVVDPETGDPVAPDLIAKAPEAVEAVAVTEDPVAQAITASTAPVVAAAAAAVTTTDKAAKPVTETLESAEDAPIALGEIETPAVVELAAKDMGTDTPDTPVAAAPTAPEGSKADIVTEAEFEITPAKTTAAAQTAAKVAETVTAPETANVQTVQAQAPASQNAAPAAAPVLAAQPPEGGQTSSVSGTPNTLPMRENVWPNQLAETISVHDFGDGQTLDIQLTPEALGKLRITMEMRDGQAMVSVVTDNPEAARLFNDNQARLADVMSKAGLTLASHDANTGGQTGGSNGENPSAQNGRGTDTNEVAPAEAEETVIQIAGEKPQINLVA